MRKSVVCIILILIMFLLVPNVYQLVMQLRPGAPAASNNIEQRLAEVEQTCYDLRAEMEDVKSVQGYMAWETDWRNRRQ